MTLTFHANWLLGDFFFQENRLLRSPRRISMKNDLPCKSSTSLELLCFFCFFFVVFFFFFCFVLFCFFVVVFCCCFFFVFCCFFFFFFFLLLLFFCLFFFFFFFFFLLAHLSRRLMVSFCDHSPSVVVVVVRMSVCPQSLNNISS